MKMKSVFALFLALVIYLSIAAFAEDNVPIPDSIPAIPLFESALEHTIVGVGA